MHPTKAFNIVRERTTKGTRSFKFGLNYLYETVKWTYIDYHSKDFKSIEIDGIKTVVNIGDSSAKL
jgi:hypothetical protein